MQHNQGLQDLVDGLPLLSNALQAIVALSGQTEGPVNISKGPDGEVLYRVSGPFGIITLIQEVDKYWLNSSEHDQ